MTASCAFGDHGRKQNVKGNSESRNILWLEGIHKHHQVQLLSEWSMWDQAHNHGITSARSDHLKAELDPHCYF